MGAVNAPARDSYSQAEAHRILAAMEMEGMLSYADGIVTWAKIK